MDSKAFALASALVLLAPLARADGPSAADRETARTLMDQGISLRDQHDLKGALQRFTAADQIMHVPSTAFEVADTQVQLGMLVEASDTLSRILNTPPQPREPAPFKEARKKAQALMDSLQGRIPTIQVTIANSKAGEPAQLTIDGAAVPAAVIGLPRAVDPGHHVVAATTRTMEGRTELDVSEGDKKQVTVTLKVQADSEEPQSEAKPLPPTPEQPHGHAGRTLGIVALGVGAAGLAAGGVFGVLTFTTQSDLATKCPNHICGPTEHGELSDANTFATVSTVAFIAGGAVAVVGVVALILSGGKSTPPPQSAHVVPWVGPGSIGVLGRF